MKNSISIALAFAAGTSLGWFASLHYANRLPGEKTDQTTISPAIRKYIANMLPLLRQNGAEHIDMEPLPYDGGGAVLVRGSVRNGDEFYILHTLLESRLTNPDLPARLVWQVTIGDGDQAPNKPI
jgi:hypothetical protein